MLISVVGVNHRTAPVEVRERLSFPEHALAEALFRLRAYPAVEGCVILSTCNRTELYVATRKLDEGSSITWDFLARSSGADISEIKNYTYSHTLCDTIRHLFRVAAGLDSMILGETEILGQVRRAYQLAGQCKTTNRVLNTLFQQAIAVGRRVRTETGIDASPVSVSYTAVELARQKFGDLRGRTVLVIGAGKMGALAARYLVASGVTGVIVSNRSYRQAVELATRFNGRAVSFAELFPCLTEADIVISCTAAAHYVIRPAQVAQALSRRQGRGREIMLIDIAVPRDIDPAVGELPGVALYDIDDLQQVADEGYVRRKRAAVAAEKIVEEELGRFMQWLSIQLVVPAISALKQRGEEIIQKELYRAFCRLGEISEHNRRVVNSLANSIVNQLLHVPVTQLKAFALTPEGHLYMRVLQNLFQLTIPGEENGSEQVAQAAGAMEKWFAAAPVKAIITEERCP